LPWEIKYKKGKQGSEEKKFMIKRGTEKTEGQGGLKPNFGSRFGEIEAPGIS